VVPSSDERAVVTHDGGFLTVVRTEFSPLKYREHSMLFASEGY